MDLDQLQQRLLAAGRADPPASTVPHGFTRRVMRALVEAPALNPWAAWNQVLWRAAAPCVGLVIMLGIWTYLAGGVGGPDHSLAEDLESTVAAPLAQVEAGW